MGRKLMVALVLMPMMALAATWYVNGASGLDSNSGTSESAPKATIQAAIDESAEGDTILVSAGTYSERIEISSGITVKSQSGSKNTKICGESGYSVVRILEGASGTVIEGFEITGGTGEPNSSSYGYDYYGGGVRCRASASIRNCIIHGNGHGTPRTNSGTFGGGISVCTGNVLVENCLFYDNFAWASGGATFVEGSDGELTISQCTIYGNDSTDFFGYQGGVGIANGGMVKVENSIVWGNGGSQIDAYSWPYNSGTTAEVLCSCVQGGVTKENVETLNSGTGNISATPNFVDAANGDYRLAVGSPCIDAGDNSYVTTMIDLAGNARIANGTVDIGCYEYNSAASSLYMVIDLSGGPTAAYYPVSYLDAVPDGGWTDEYKTTKLVMRRIPAGTFIMGDGKDENLQQVTRHRAVPMHSVTLTKDFYIGVFEVTQRQWELVMGNNPSYFSGSPDSSIRPVETVSYNMIRGTVHGAEWPQSSNVDEGSFLAVLRTKTKLESLDLPTAAQWEYACRAGTTTDLNTGVNLTNALVDAKLNGVGWYSGNSSGSTHAVGLCVANNWGLYDMHGNVWEWCLDWCDYVTGDPAIDPVGPASQRDWGDAARVFKGGTYNQTAGQTRSGLQSEYGCHRVSHLWGDFGFRLAMTTTEGATLTDGLVAYYPFDGNANDASGNGNHGTTHGTTLTTDRFGNANGAYYFDGSAYIEVPHSESLTTVTNSMTFAVWFKLESAYVDAWVPFICKGSSSRQFGFLIHKVGTDLRMFVNDYEGTGNGLTLETSISLSAINSGEWYNFALSYNGAELKAYVNGVLSGSYSVSDSFLPNSAALYIGKDSPGSTEYLNRCALDDLRIYNRALSAAEVKALYDGTAVIGNSGLSISYYDAGDKETLRSFNMESATYEDAVTYFETRTPSLVLNTYDIGANLDFGNTYYGTCRFHGKYASYVTDYFWAFMKGSIVLSEAGMYEFGFDCDDSCVIYIDGQKVVGSSNNYDSGGAFYEHASVMLSAGVHSVAIVYGEANFDSGLTVYMKAPSESSVSPLPQSILYNGTVTPEPVTYTVTFNLNGASGAAPAGRNVAEGAAVGELPDVTRTGYSFDGWYTAASGGTKITASTTVTGDVTYYAHWTAAVTPPSWTPVSKEESMVVYATVQDSESGRAIDADGARLAAFTLGGECRGVAEIMDGPNGRLFQLTVGVSSATESGIVLKVWDSATGETIDIPGTISCNSSYAIGSIAAPRVFTVGASELAATLRQGWNWFSTCLAADDMSVGTVFAGCTFADNDVVKSASGSATYYGGAWYPATFRIAPGVAYCVKKSAGGQEGLTLHGSPMDDGVAVKAGWNWIGSTRMEETTVADVSHTGSFADNDVVKTAGSSATFYGGQWYPASFKFAPGQGYKMKLANGGTLRFASGGAKARGNMPAGTARAAQKRAADEARPDWTPVPQEESLVAYLQVAKPDGSGMFDADGSVLAAFSSSGECRGVAEIMEGPSGKLFQIAIGVASATESGLTLKVWDADSGKVYEIADKLSCNSDYQIGGIAAPVIASCTEIPATRTVTFIAGMKANVDIGLVGYAAKGLPAGLKYDAKTGLVTGSAKEVGEYEATFAKNGKDDVSAVFVVRAEEVSVGCEGLSLGALTSGVAGGAGGIPLEIGTETGIKSVAVSKLPAGMKYDAKAGLITGAPTKAGDYAVTVTVTAKSGAKRVVTIPVTVAALPEGAVGTFNGFVKAADGEENVGTFQLTATDAGKLTAKVTTAAGSCSFGGACWDSVEDGVYSVALATKKGEKLTLSLDSAAGWDANQLTGTFAEVSSKQPRQVVARKNAFGKTWFFKAAGNESAGWTLSYAENAKAAALTVTLNADGSTKMAGKLGALGVNASGYADVTGLSGGVIFADFAPVVSVKDGKAPPKRVLSIRANLWFDRSNDHAEGVGAAKLTMPGT